MNKPVKILIIDDDEINNLICTKVIKDYNPAIIVESLTSSTRGLTYLEERVKDNPEDLPDVILLDINMPTISGWDFIREYRKMMTAVEAEKIKLFVLTSSQYYQDAELADQYREVQKLFTKPLTSEILEEVDTYLVKNA
ncbi:MULTISPECIES: response regulator [Reichenbachiella]|uniref:CheY chemotaxis protein or a CheY-like REC (Receiver) domain n=1 Tax=Reichenbachiella agariperforans TaxID=156994 RepID=A0A1M6REA3_REIAG|nr:MULTISPECIES: response regulator [Reichenbachiella]MBU2915359.1 response regulator [Reichenbachiella agariperforans]SHK30698.1 CheY chemotaxis protein or a CheY-like REC (receiver) domain [Reichenbachiella agariperforans]